MHYYVDPVTGDDSYSGSLTQSWKTLCAAVARLEPGDFLSVRDGEYNERVSLSRSGRADARITIETYKGETPLIDGNGISISLWEEGLFEGRGISYVDLIGLGLVNSEHNGFLFDDDAHHFSLVGLRTEDTGSSGIWAWDCHDFEIEEAEIVGACVGSGAQECITVARSSHFEVCCSEVRDSGGGPDGGGQGIDFKDGCSYGRAYRNKVHDLQEIGIYIDAASLHTHHLELCENEVFRINNTGIAVATERGGLLEDILLRKNVSHRNGHAGFMIGGWSTVRGPSPMNRIELSRNTGFLNGVDSKGLGGGISHNNLDAQNVSILDNVLSQNVVFQIQLWKYGVGPTEAIVDGNLIDGFRDHKTETRGTNYIERDVIGSLMTLTNLS